VRVPRDLSGDALAARLDRLGYRVSRQSGSHLRLTTALNGEHHITIPRHAALRVGTLAAILAELERHHHLERQQVLASLLP